MTEGLTASTRIRTAPRDTSDEVYLTELWKEILGLSAVGADDRYLDLGGNSAALYQIVERIKSDLGYEIDPRIFFDPKHSTLRDIAAVLSARRPAQEIATISNGGAK